MHFLTCDEVSITPEAEHRVAGRGRLTPVRLQMADAEGVLRRWLSACVTAGGVLAARQTLHARPLLVAQMLEEWLNHYRRLA